MHKKECQFCHKTTDLFSIDTPTDIDDLTDTRYVCGACWDTIAEIARRMVKTAIV